jgi:hypothetical protein
MILLSMDEYHRTQIVFFVVVIFHGLDATHIVLITAILFHHIGIGLTLNA